MRKGRISVRSLKRVYEVDLERVIENRTTLEGEIVRRVENDPNAENLFKLGFLRLMQDNVVEGIDALKKSLELKQQSKSRVTLNHINKIIELTKESERLSKTGDHAKAVGLLSKAERKSKDFPAISRRIQQYLIVELRKNMKTDETKKSDLRHILTLRNRQFESSLNESSQGLSDSDHKINKEYANNLEKSIVEINNNLLKEKNIVEKYDTEVVSLKSEIKELKISLAALREENVSLHKKIFEMSKLNDLNERKVEEKEDEIMKLKKGESFEGMNKSEVNSILVTTNIQQTINEMKMRNKIKLNEIMERYELSLENLNRRLFSLEEEEKRMCEICEERPKSIAFLCGHLVCAICSSKILKSENKVCPFCRKNIRAKIKIFGV